MSGNTVPRSKQIGLSLYFSINASGTSKRGMLHIFFVFWRALRIHQSPLLSLIICSVRNVLTSVKARPLKIQKRYISRTCANLGTAISFAMMRSISSFTKNSFSTFVSRNFVNRNGSDVIHPFIRAMRITFFRFFSRLTAVL